jgi:hypothetical protein
LLVAAVPVVTGAVRLAAVLGRPFTSGGDDAFIELGVRAALRHVPTVGPYSRFGWHHPGPLMFELFAPLYAASGDRSRALFLDSWLLAAACALGVVAILRRFAGEAAALAAAALVAGWSMATGFDRLIDPWNPSVLALPVLLTLVAAAAAAGSGSLGALLVAAMAGSVAAQTHLGTVPVVVAALALGTGGCLWTRGRRPPAPPPRWRWRWAGAVVLLLAWAGPAADVIVHGRASNLAAITRFLLHPPVAAGPSHQPLGAALRAAATYPAVVPFGFPNGLVGGGGRLAWCAACAALGLSVAVVGRRRAPVAAALGAATPVGLAVAVLAASRVTGPLEPYLLWWTSLLALPALLGAAALASTVPTRPGGRRRAVTLAVAAATAVAVTAGWTRLAVVGATASYADSPSARVVAAAVVRSLGPAPFRLEVADPQFATSATVLALAKAGERFALQPPMDLYAGTAAPGDPVPVVVLEGPAAPPPAGGRLVAAAGTLVAYRLAPAPPPAG